MASIQQMREQREAKAKELRKLNDDTPEGAWGEAEQKAYDAAVAEIDRLDGAIERQQKIDNLTVRQNQRIERKAFADGISEGQAAAELEQERAITAAWMRGGVSALTDEQREASRARAAQRAGVYGTMSTGTGSEGGYTVPSEVATELLEEVKEYGGVRDVATVMRTAGGHTINWPTMDDTAEEGELVGENAQVSGSDPTFGTVGIGAYKYSSKSVAVPFELLQDSSIDIVGYVYSLLGGRLGRITNKHFTVGTGSNQPKGLVTASSLGVTGAAGQTASVTFNDLIALEHSVDPAYRKNQKCGWQFNDDTLKVLKMLKDADGRPLWMPGLTVADPNTIMRYPYTINQSIEKMAAGAKSILFGDFSKYLVRDVLDVQLFRMVDSKYTEKGQVGFLAFSRADGNLIAASNKCIKHYANAAA